MTDLTLKETEELYSSMDLSLEQPGDICGARFAEQLADAVEADGGEPPLEWKLASASREGASVPGHGKVLKEIRGAGKVYDWRDSSWTPVNGGRISLRGFTHHIPVVRNVDGYADIVTLRNVLVAQDLMVQTCTDREGNIGLFTPFDMLCYQARGGNQLTTGCEHMHLSTSEDWSKRQLRSMAWVIQLCERKHHVPRTRWRLSPGDGVVRFRAPGQGWHSEIAYYAGYKDRSDPWGNTPHDVVLERWAYVRHCIEFFEKHGHFSGA